MNTLEDQRDALAGWCIQEATHHEQSARDTNNGGFGVDEEDLARARSFRQIAALLLRGPDPTPRGAAAPPTLEARVRETLQARMRPTTHWPGCEEDHWECGMVRVLDNYADALASLAARAEAAERERDALRAMLTEQHYMGSPVGPDGYQTEIVMVAREWYERLRALAAAAPPLEETDG